jgi:FAD dependent oxidoreductase
MRNENLYDVVVVGGGPAGCAASLAASRNGAKTLLIESHPYLGGAATSSLVSPWMTNYHGDKQVIKGIFQEIVDELIKYDGSTGTLKCPYDEPGKTQGTGGHITPFDAEVLKFVLNKLLLEAGVEILFNTSVGSVSASEGKVTRLELKGKSEQKSVSGKVYVDATGDGYIASAAGAEFEFGRKEDGLTQPVSLLFKMTHVDLDKFIDYVRAHKEEFVWVTFPELPDDLPGHYAQQMVAVTGFNALVAEGQKSGELYLGRERITIFSDFKKGEVIFNATRLNQIDGTNEKDMLYAEIELRKQMMSLVQFAKKNLPGFQNAFLGPAAANVGVRETRRIMGDYLLTEQDVLKGRKFPDSIAKGCFPIDIHSPSDKKNRWTELEDAYDIPYRAICPKKLENLYMAGRCISATHEALASVRVQSHAMAIGQAAGTAAALAAKQNHFTRDMNVPLLQETLKEQGAII